VSILLAIHAIRHSAIHAFLFHLFAIRYTCYPCHPLSNAALLATSEKVALTAVLESEDVTVRGVRLRGPGRRRGGAGVAMAGKPVTATAPGPRIRLLRRASVLGTDGSGGTDLLDGTDAMSPRAFTGNRVRWDGGIVP
jgi:hypothetical protein